MKNLCHYARRLRRELPPEERQLWLQLRSRRFAHYKFRRPHPVGHFILDFACCEARLAIELDGGQHDKRRADDARRTAWLNTEGWAVLRFWNNELRDNEEGVLMVILEELRRLLPSPRPSP